MSMTEHSEIRVRAPRFRLDDLAILYWEDEERQTKILKRWFDPDENEWWYETYHEEGRRYPECAFDPPQREGPE